ncbi:hypothetical protein [Coleofasciculus sp. E1-EBD-02]|jgi:hypothetical protein|uniref:hypothetical protein n=1 Tax=Coleofasciculus sp. E1-EBD-02 TaxID=3068481 RepID=UPI0032F8ADFA
MTANSDQPNPNDAVLGGQDYPLNSGVLGGLEGVKQRLTSESEEIRMAALDEALNYGQPGRYLLRQVVKNETGNLQLKAYNLLSEQVDEKEKQELQTYLSPDLQIDLKFDLEIDTKELGEAIERAVDRALGRRGIASADSHSSIPLAGTAPMPPLAGTAPVPPPIEAGVISVDQVNDQAGNNSKAEIANDPPTKTLGLLRQWLKNKMNRYR